MVAANQPGELCGILYENVMAKKQRMCFIHHATPWFGHNSFPRRSRPATLFPEPLNPGPAAEIPAGYNPRRPSRSGIRQRFDNPRHIEYLYVAGADEKHRQGLFIASALANSSLAAA